MNIKREWRYQHEGEDTWLEGVIHKAYQECSELRVVPYDLTYSRIIQDTIENGRYEYRCIVDDELAAVAIIVRDYDLHVGDSWAIQWNYVKPEYRNQGIAREVFSVIRKLSKDFNIPYSYTKRIGEGVYSLTYKTTGVQNHG